MKQALLLGLLAATAFSSQALAIPQSPYLRPDSCPDEGVKRPDGDANGYLYYSKDCSTAYVLPRDRASMEMSEPGFGFAVTAKNCERVDKVSDRIDIWNTVIDNAATTAAELNKDLLGADEAKKTLINEKLAILEQTRKSADAELQKIRAEYEDIEGYHYQVSFSTNVSADIAAYDAANPSHKIHFEAAPIKDGVLAFFQQKKKAKMKAILETGVPGLSASGTDEFAVSSYINMNGGLSGKVILTLPGSCAILQKPTNTPTENLMVANFAYTVPVQTAWGYNAEIRLKADDLHSEVTHIAEVTKDMNRSDLVDRLLGGSLKQYYKFTWVTGGASEDQLPKANPRSKTGSLQMDIEAGVRADMADMLVAKLESLGYILRKNTSDLPIGQVNPVKTPYEIQQRVCETKRIFGIKVGEDCHDETETRYELTTGQASNSESVTDTSEISQTRALSIEAVVSVLHTSSFVGKKGGAQ